MSEGIEHISRMISASLFSHRSHVSETRDFHLLVALIRKCEALRSRGPTEVGMRSNVHRLEPDRLDEEILRCWTCDRLSSRI